MEIRIADLINDSIVDGPGLRFTIFVQGCPHGCPSCHNQATHDFSGGLVTDTEKIMKLVKKNPLLAGITLSGGEPFCQAEPCAHLAHLAKLNHLNVWTYTGYTLEEIFHAQRQDWQRLLLSTDVLVDGRFLESQKSLTLPFRGSANQRLIDVKRTLSEKEIVLFAP